MKHQQLKGGTVCIILKPLLKNSLRFKQESRKGKMVERAHASNSMWMKPLCMCELAITSSKLDQVFRHKLLLCCVMRLPKVKNKKEEEKISLKVRHMTKWHHLHQRVHELVFLLKNEAICHIAARLPCDLFPMHDRHAMSILCSCALHSL